MILFPSAAYSAIWATQGRFEYCPLLVLMINFNGVDLVKVLNIYRGLKWCSGCSAFVSDREKAAGDKKGFNE